MQQGRRRHPLWRSDVPPPPAGSRWAAGAAPAVAPIQQQAAGFPAAGQHSNSNMALGGDAPRQPVAAGPAGPAAAIPSSPSAGAMQATGRPMPAQAGPGGRQQAEPVRKQFLCRVRVALLESCRAAVMIHQELAQMRKVSSSHSPKFPLEKLEEAFRSR